MIFPLEQWFDVTKPIPKSDADLTEAQMMLYALKDGIDPDCVEAKRQYREMRKAVKEHNDKFPQLEPYCSKALKLRQQNILFFLQEITCQIAILTSRF